MGTGSACECKRSKSFCNWCEPQKTINVLSEENERLKKELDRIPTRIRIWAKLFPNKLKSLLENQ